MVAIMSILLAGSALFGLAFPAPTLPSGVSLPAGRETPAPPGTGNTSDTEIHRRTLPARPGIRVHRGYSTTGRTQLSVVIRVDPWWNSRLYDIITEQGPEFVGYTMYIDFRTFLLRNRATYPLAQQFWSTYAALDALPTSVVGRGIYEDGFGFGIDFGSILGQVAYEQTVAAVQEWAHEENGLQNTRINYWASLIYQPGYGGGRGCGRNLALDNATNTDTENTEKRQQVKTCPAAENLLQYATLEVPNDYNLFAGYQFYSPCC